MDAMKLPEKERKEYNTYLRHMRDIASRNHTIEIETNDIIKKTKEETHIEVIIGLYENSVPIDVIAKSLKMSQENVMQIVENYKNKV